MFLVKPIILVFASLVFTAQVNAQYIATEHDQSGAILIYVHGVSGRVAIAKGEIVWVEIPERRFRWDSDGVDEYATMPKGTKWIRVSRDPCGREINWECYGPRRPGM